MINKTFLPRDPMSGMDAAWLRMAHPTNLLVIVGVMTFREKLDIQKLNAVLEQRLLAFPRFKQKAVQDHSGSWWEPDKNFDLAHHLKRVKLNGRAGKEELEGLISELVGEGLDFTRPLWQFHLIENYSSGSALVIRIHHCYADGAALTSVMLALTGKTAAESLHAIPKKPDNNEIGLGDFWHSVSKPNFHVWNAAAKLLRGILEQGLEIVKDPTHTRDFAAKGIELAGELRRLKLTTTDVPSCFKGHLGRNKRVAWSDLSLAEVKIIGKTLGCSVNDILLSTVAGVLRDYLQQHGDTPHDMELQVAVPVNLHPPEKASELGNQLGIIFVALPVGIEDPLDRLYHVRERMRAAKSSHQAVVTSILLSAAGLGPKIMQDQISALIGRNATAVTANIPGPPYPLYLAGREIAELNFWTPQVGGIGLGFSFFTYHGKVQIGLITDTELVSDPKSMIDRFGTEFEKLVLMTLMGYYRLEDEN